MKSTYMYLAVFIIMVISASIIYFYSDSYGKEANSPVDSVLYPKDAVDSLIISDSLTLNRDSLFQTELDSLVVDTKDSIRIGEWKEKYGPSSGTASWYGPGFHGRTTANGEKYDMYGLTAAHKKLPFGTKVKVTLLSSGKSIIVIINDRGPFVGGRIIDLSKGAKDSLGMGGLGKVQLEIIE